MGENAIVKLLHATVRVSHVDEAGRALMQAVGFDDAGKPVLAPSTKIVTVEQGEPLPENLAPGEFERLSALGALEAPAKTPRTPSPEDAEAEATLSNLGGLADDELARFLGESGVGVKRLLHAVGGDADLAKRVIEAEKTATNGDGRASLTGPLEKLIEKGGAA